MKTRQPLNASHCATQDKNEERKHNEDRKKPDNPRAKPRKKQHDVWNKPHENRAKQRRPSIYEEKPKQSIQSCLHI